MGKLYQQLKQYGEGDYYPYHMPGHKRRLCGAMPKDLLQTDITEIDGFDNLHQAEGILRELQERAARLYGAEESFYLVNGSTSGILSAVSAALPDGGHILMARNSHKSAYHVAYLRNLTVSYLYPTVNQEYDICDAITPEQVRAALEAEPDIGAVFIVSPTYEGRISDIKAIAQVVHEKGLPLIVDEAHGAHLGLVQEDTVLCHTGKYHINSCQAGADIVIHSVHKTLPAMTQTALLHVNGNRIDRDRLKRFLHIYQTSSPSYVLMASIDNALQLIEKKGVVLYNAFYSRYLLMLERLQKCKYLQFVPLDGQQDMGKLVISGKRAGVSGQQIYEMLLNKYHSQLEMAAGSYCLAMFTIGDTEEGFGRLETALLSIDNDVEAIAVIETESVKNTGRTAIESENILSEKFILGDTDKKERLEAIPLALAWDMPYEEVLPEAAIGRHVAEFINLYPPGVPLLVPGERMCKAQWEQISQYLEQGLTVQGISAKPPYQIRVIRHQK